MLSCKITYISFASHLKWADRFAGIFHVPFSSMWYWEHSVNPLAYGAPFKSLCIMLLYDVIYMYNTHYQCSLCYVEVIYQFAGKNQCSGCYLSNKIDKLSCTLNIWSDFHSLEALVEFSMVQVSPITIVCTSWDSTE